MCVPIKPVTSLNATLYQLSNRNITWVDVLKTDVFVEKSNASMLVYFKGVEGTAHTQGRQEIGCVYDAVW